MTPITPCDIVKQGKTALLLPENGGILLGSSAMEHVQNSAVFRWVVINCLLFNKWNLLIVQGEFIKITDVFRERYTF